MQQDKRRIRKVQLAHEILRVAHSNGWKAGRHLTEQSLAEALGVSRSPVRSALDLLEDWGAVTNRPNAGYRLVKNAESLLSVGEKVPPSAEEELYAVLIDARLAGDLGATVTQSTLMQRFHVSRIVVDRVLERMVEEGLMQRLKGRGWHFLEGFDSTLTWETGYQLRLVLEPASLLLPQFTIDRDWLSRMRLAHEDLSRATKTKRHLAAWIYSIDAEFHEMIATFAGNAFFLQAIQHQNKLRRLLEYRGYANRGRIGDWCAEHLSIIEQLERGDSQAASRLMRSHLEQAREATAAAEPRGLSRIAS